MKEFNNIEGFEWDKGNLDKNREKHGISNSESEQIFFNELLLISDDQFHTTKQEPRFFALGKTDSGKHLTVVFTVRRNLIRIISSRMMSKKERKIYNEKI